MSRDEVPSNKEENDAIEGPSECDPRVLVVLAPSSDGSSHDEVDHDKGEEEHAGGHPIETVIKLEFVLEGFLGGNEFLGFRVAPWKFTSLGDKGSVMSSGENGVDS